MTTVSPSAQPIRRPGRPSKDFAWTNGHIFSPFLTGHGRITKDPGFVSKLLPNSHVWIACSCKCGRYTPGNPKAIRLDHLLSEGDKATISCGCVGQQRYKENGEAAAAKLGDAAVRAVFAAFARRPGWQHVKAIAKRFDISTWKVGAVYRYWMKRIVAMRDGIIEGFQQLSALELRWAGGEHAHKYSTIPRAASEWVLDDEDVVEPHTRSMFGLAPMAA